MSVPATLIQGAILTQVSANSNINAEFAGKIKKGVGRNFNFNTDGRGIRVFLYGEDCQMADVVGQGERSQYHYLIAVMFFEPDEEVAEVNKADYLEWLRASLRSDRSLAGNAENIDFGRAQYKEDPVTNGIHYVILPVIVETIR